jgi:hypothetical protein
MKRTKLKIKSPWLSIDYMKESTDDDSFNFKIFKILMDIFSTLKWAFSWLI